MIDFWKKNSHSMAPAFFHKANGWEKIAEHGHIILGLEF